MNLPQFSNMKTHIFIPSAMFNQSLVYFVYNSFVGLMSFIFIMIVGQQQKFCSSNDAVVLMQFLTFFSFQNVLVRWLFLKYVMHMYSIWNSKILWCHITLIANMLAAKLNFFTLFDLNQIKINSLCIFTLLQSSRLTFMTFSKTKQEVSILFYR